MKMKKQKTTSTRHSVHHVNIFSSCCSKLICEPVVRFHWPTFLEVLFITREWNFLEDIKMHHRLDPREKERLSFPALKRKTKVSSFHPRSDWFFERSKIPGNLHAPPIVGLYEYANEFEKCVLRICIIFSLRNCLVIRSACTDEKYPRNPKRFFFQFGTSFVV